MNIGDNMKLIATHRANERIINNPECSLFPKIGTKGNEI